LTLEEIQPYDRNPRDNAQAVAAVKESMQEFGFLVPLVIDQEGVIVAGHTRYEAARQLNWGSIPAIRATHLSDAQIRQFRIIDNKVAEAARWDFDLLAQEMTALSDSGIDFTKFGFTQEEVDCLSDVVQDDCLSGDMVNQLNDEASRRRSEHRAPSQTRFVIGTVVFFTPKTVYDEWIQEVRERNDFVEDDIIADLKERLGIQRGD
jgi:hypothetical protein